MESKFLKMFLPFVPLDNPIKLQVLEIASVSNWGPVLHGLSLQTSLLYKALPQKAFQILSPVVCQGQGEKEIQVVSKDVFVKDSFLQLLSISSIFFL